jgi:hypothetical protein
VPFVDLRLLVALKRAPDYRMLREQIASPCPIDVWMDEQVTFFTFAGRADSTDPAHRLQVVFALDPQGYVLGAGCAEIPLTPISAEVSE